MDNQDADMILVKSVVTGNKAAFDSLVLKYQYRVGCVIARYIDDPGIVSDLTQEVFLKTYRAIAQFQGNSSFYTWLYRITVNTTKNYLKVKNRQPRESNIDVATPELMPGRYRLREYTTPEHMVSCGEIEAAVSFAMNALPSDLRESWLLRERDGLSYDAIAREMSCPVGTVRSRIFRARALLDQEIRPYLKG